MNTITIDEEEGFTLLSGVLLKTLKRNGWTGCEVEQIQHEIYLEALQAVRLSQEAITEELNAFVAQCGFDEKALLGLARTEFALRGFDLANTLTQRRQALCN